MSEITIKINYMKFTTKLFLAWTSIFLIFYLSVIASISLFWGIRFPFWQLAVVFVISGVLPPAFLTMLFYRKLDYMESDDLDPPRFSGTKNLTIFYKPRTRRVYDEVFQKIDKGFIVSYSDKASGVIKFRTDSRVLSWGVCGYVRLMDDERIEAIVYSMNADSKREEKVLLQTLKLLDAILT